MSDTATIVSAFAVAVLGVAGYYRSPNRLRSHLKTDTEILANLPRESQSFALLLADVERRVTVLTRQPRKRRNAKAMTTSSITFVASVWLVSAALVQRGFWGSLLGIEGVGVAAIAMVRFKNALAFVDRDASGARIKPKVVSSAESIEGCSE